MAASLVPVVTKSVGEQNSVLHEVMQLHEHRTRRKRLSRGAVSCFVGNCDYHANELPRVCKALSKLQAKFPDLLRPPNEQNPIISNMQIVAFLKKLKSMTMLIPVIGTASSGKSTLINAILGDNFLPCDVERKTQVTIYIEHDGRMRHTGQCKKSSCRECPALYIGFGTNNKTPIAYGVEAICQKVTEYNQIPQEVGKKMCLHLLANVPCIAVRDDDTELPLTPYLVDCESLEGLIEDNEEYCTRAIPTIILVHSYEQLRQDKESIIELLEKVQYSKAEKFVAVTHFDAFYNKSSSSDYPTKEETGEMIASIASQTAAKIESHHVFPICSRWALDGRIFSQSHGTTLSTHLQSAMLMYNDTLGTDTSNPEDLVEESGIQPFESYIESIGQIRWCRSIQKDLKALIKLLVESADSSVTRLDKAISENQTKLVAQQNAKPTLKKNRSALASRSRNTALNAQLYRDQLVKIINVPEEQTVLTVIDESIVGFLEDWKKQHEGHSTDKSILQFLIGVEELLKKTIPSRVCGLTDHAERNLVSALTRLEQELRQFEEEHSAYCQTLELLQDREVTYGALPLQCESQTEPVELPASYQCKELLRSFKQSVETKSPPVPVPSAISVVDLLTMPLAVKRFQESKFHSKVLALSQKYKEATRTSSSMKNTISRDETHLLQNLTAMNEDLKEMEEKLKELTSQKDYKDQLLKGFRQVTINRLTELYACAIQEGAKCLLDDLDSKPIKQPDFRKKEKSIQKMADVKAAIKKLISPEVTYVPILQLI